MLQATLVLLLAHTIRQAPLHRPLAVPLALRGGAANACTPTTEGEEDALRKEYSRYVAAVETPLHNVDTAVAQRTQAVRPLTLTLTLTLP